MHFKKPAYLFATLCLVATAQAAKLKQVVTNFGTGPSGWSAGFGDYPVGSETFYELKSGMRKLPPSAGLAGKAFFLNGHNHSDDLCMFLRRKIVGLSPNTKYRVKMSVTFASTSPNNAGGVGGAPSDVWIKAGVSRTRPGTTGSYARLNIDKGNSATSGRDAKVIGDVGVDVPILGARIYRLKTLTNDQVPFTFKTDGTGAGWLFVCSDSGFEAWTTLYFTRISFSFTPR